MTVSILSGSTWVNITPYIAYQGITFSRNDVEAPDAGRTLDGIMRRGRISYKERMDITTVPLKNSAVKTLQTLLEPETISVKVNPYPMTNASKTMTMYSNDVKTTYTIHRSDGTDLFTMSFPLVEV